jgi:hypothetical protein
MLLMEGLLLRMLLIQVLPPVAAVYAGMQRLLLQMLCV